MGGTPTTPAPTGFEYKLADGTVVKAENIEEAFKTVAKMKEDTAAALRAERESREQMQGQIDQMRADLQRQAHPPDTGKFDRNHYYQLVGEDPIAAQNYLDAWRFGIPDPQQVPEYFGRMSNTVTQLEQQTLAANFINLHPDFPATGENAQILTKEVMRLREAGHPVNMDTLDLAWRNCQSNDTIQPMEEPEKEEQPNPSLGGGGSASLDAETIRVGEDAMSGKMSMADFEKFLNSKGMATR